MKKGFSTNGYPCVKKSEHQFLLHLCRKIIWDEMKDLSGKVKNINLIQENRIRSCNFE